MVMASRTPQSDKCEHGMTRSQIKTIVVEEAKAPEEQGYYLHLELFGAGTEKSLSMRSPEPSAMIATQTTARAVLQETI
jgi:hypothetical protein